MSIDFKTLTDEEKAICNANFLKPKAELERLILDYRARNTEVPNILTSPFDDIKDICDNIYGYLTMASVLDQNVKSLIVNELKGLGFEYHNFAAVGLLHLYNKAKRRSILCIEPTAEKFLDFRYKFSDCVEFYAGYDLKVIGRCKKGFKTDHMFSFPIGFLDLSLFDISELTNISGMFRECRANTINLSTFNTSKVVNMCELFEGCSTPYLDLSSFNMGSVNETYCMFRDCKAEVKATDQKILQALLIEKGR